MRKGRIYFMVQAAMIAALYVVLTYLANLLDLASGAVQVRLSESLTVLPYFTFAAVPGLFIGCLLANILTGAVMIDVIAGSLATLAGAVLTFLLRKSKWLASVPPIAANTLVIPFVLIHGYGLPGEWWYYAVTVGLGELVSCGVLGMMLLFALDRYKKYLF